MRKVLMSRYKTFSLGNSITCSTNCKYKTAAKVCVVETLFFFRCLIVNNPHKGVVNDGDYKSPYIDLELIMRFIC
jgi:hypothetical protein